MFKIKRRLALLSVFVTFIAYYLAVDPDTTFFRDLAFGSSLILALNIFVIALASILLIEFVPDFFVDEIYGKESELRKKASETSSGSGLAMMAKSLRILGYSIIVAASIIAYSFGG